MNIIEKKDALLAPLVRIIPPAVTPNQLSITRLVLTVPIVMLLLYEYRAGAFFLFLVAVFLDMLDGALARSRNRTSTSGAYLDPIADKALFVSALVVLGFRIIPFNLFATVLFLEIIT